MPVYEYMCSACGPFTDIRPMAEYEKPQVCPDCRRKAPRVLLTAPRFSTLAVELRTAHATNERSAHAPDTLSALKSQHGSSCSCCAGLTYKKSRKTARGKNGAKSFPGARPWMISH
ncbi:MAG TPA: zinc ribbon domain-containing protein [Xanthobacteraceae bacterium]|nr:zinc ribbon domain-containing protein [Xanthobacteraceae bacterium]